MKDLSRMILGGLIGAAIAIGIQYLIGIDEAPVHKLTLEQDSSLAETPNPLSDSSNQ